MSRPLVPGLLAEGTTDELFLGPLVSRQLRAISESSPRCVTDVDETQIGDCRTIRDLGRVAEAVLALADDCHIVCVHNDANERSKADRVVALLRERGRTIPAIPLVPIRETEAWLLADASAWRSIPGANLSALPSRPADVERIADPKITLDSVLPGRARRRQDYFDYMGQNVDLDVLAQVPAYAAWTAEARDALKGLGYL